jgi:phenylpropionate dioxygenase-like ring-hydroxylating dioxygenase large terminal subunit
MTAPLTRDRFKDASQPQDADLKPADLRRTGLNPDYWYPICRSDEVKAGLPKPVSFAGEPIVLVRGKSGVVFALEDRCAHRQVPLHKGVVRGDGLQCGYHGWTYGADGRCLAVPYLAENASMPRGVKSYPAREAYGYVFIFPGSAKAEQVPFPNIPAVDDPRYKTRHLYRQVDCHYSFMHENLMDMNHQFLHRRLMGRIRTTFLGYRASERMVEAEYSFKRTGGSKPIGERFIIGMSKGQDRMTITTDYPYQTLRYWPPAGGPEPALDLWNVYVPIDREQRRNRTFGFNSIRRPPKAPWLINLMWPAILWFTGGIFAEDRAIVELEQKAHDAQGTDWNQEIFPAIRALKELLLARGVPLSA